MANMYRSYKIGTQESYAYGRVYDIGEGRVVINHGIAHHEAVYTAEEVDQLIEALKEIQEGVIR